MATSKFAERLANLPAFESLNWLWGILICQVFIFTSLIIIYQILQLAVNLLFNQNGHSKISVYSHYENLQLFFLHFHPSFLPLIQKPNSTQQLNEIHCLFK